MFVQLALCLVVIEVCFAQTETSSQPIMYPVRILASNGTCPSEQQRAEFRRQITADVTGLLNPGLSEDYPASSCSEINNRPSGYYWIQPPTGPPAIRLYCDFNRRCGCSGPSAWTRVAFINASDPSQDCPTGLEEYIHFTFPFRLCGGSNLNGRDCGRHFYSTFGLPYNRVCGSVEAYQHMNTIGFYAGVVDSFTIDQPYLSGVSITHGPHLARQHVWSFASADGDSLTPPDGDPNRSCPCMNPLATTPPYVGDDYFCDSGNHGQNPTSNFLPDDPLWDGSGCSSSSNCCAFNSPPWFCKTLPQATTDDLEVRVCHTNGARGEFTPVENLEIYIQ